MLQEYRVSLFSQQLKTRYPISSKRLDKQWGAVLEQVNVLGLDK
jgi:ATP-dependent helicase HrpA